MNESTMAFPANQLVATGGELSSHVYENRSTSVPRDLYWSASLNFAPLNYCGESLECSATVEWLRIPNRNFRDINQTRIKFGEDDPISEASFYMSRHDVARTAMMTLSYLDDDRFRLALEMTVDFLGYDEGDENPNLYVTGEADVTYTGLIIVPDNLSPKPTTETDVLGIAEAFADLDCYQKPIHQGFRYLLPPQNAG